MLSDFRFIVMTGFAVFYFRAAQLDDSSPILFSGLSVIVSLIVWTRWGWGFWGMVLAQFLLFVLIAIFRIAREIPSRRRD